MHRPLRFLFTLATAFSVALQVAAASMWVRGRFVSDVWSRQTGDTARVVLSGGGRIAVRTLSGAPVRREDPWQWEARAPGPVEDAGPNALGWPGKLGAGFVDRPKEFFIEPPPGSSPSHPVFFTVRLREGWLSYGLVAAAAAVLPLSWLATFHRARGPRCAGHCRACGYDLRATPAAAGKGGTLLERCPECGKASARAMAPARPPGKS